MEMECLGGLSNRLACPQSPSDVPKLVERRTAAADALRLVQMVPITEGREKRPPRTPISRLVFSFRPTSRGATAGDTTTHERYRDA